LLAACVFPLVWFAPILPPFFLSNTSLPPQEAIITWPPSSQYNTRLLRQKAIGACLHMPQDGHWLASFEVMPPPKGFSAAKNENSPLKTAVSDLNFRRFVVFRQKIVTPFSTLAIIKGSLPTNSTTPDRLR
jgi:hypothetical protein